MKVYSAIKLEHKYYDMLIFSLNDEEWVIGTKTQMHRAAQAEVEQSLWCIDTAYIADFMADKNPVKYSGQDMFDVIKNIQATLGERANPILQVFIGEDIDELINNAIDDDGVGSHLSSYDGKIHRSSKIKGLNPGYGPLCFRMN